MILYRTLLFIILHFLSVAYAHEKYEPTTCILSFFKKDSREDRVVNSVYGRYLPSIIVRVTKLEDVKKCFKPDYREIIWLGHTAQNPLSNMAPVLIYYDNNNPLPIYSRYYENLLRYIRDTNYLPEKIRFAGCQLGQTDKGSIHNFIRELESLNVKIEYSPKSKFFSKIYGHPVTDLDESWLLRGIDCEDRSKWMNGYPSHFCRTPYFDKYIDQK